MNGGTSLMKISHELAAVKPRMVWIRSESRMRPLAHTESGLPALVRVRVGVRVGVGVGVRVGVRVKVRVRVSVRVRAKVRVRVRVRVS